MSYDETVGHYRPGSRYTSYLVAPHSVNEQLPKQPSSTASNVTNSHNRSAEIMSRHNDPYSMSTLPGTSQNDLALPPYSLVDQSMPPAGSVPTPVSGHPVAPIARGTDRNPSTQVSSYRTIGSDYQSPEMSTGRPASITRPRESQSGWSSLDSASLARQWRESQMDRRPAQPSALRPNIQVRRTRLPSCPPVSLGPRNDLLERRIGTTRRRFSHGDQSISTFPGGLTSTRARIEALERHMAPTSLSPRETVGRRDTRLPRINSSDSEFGSSVDISLASSSVHRLRISDTTRTKPSYPFTPVEASMANAPTTPHEVTQVESASTGSLNKPLPIRPNCNIEIPTYSEHSGLCSICTSTLPTYDESQLLLAGSQQRCPCRLLELFPPDEQLEILDELTNEIPAIALQIQEYRLILCTLSPEGDRDAFDQIVESIKELERRRDSCEKYVNAFQGLMRVLLER
ncbi:hypothetical protein BCR39DRAFT_557765 [Naematelia encephala]|uniref:Uncharacterized protein n=1 Tax=Naematelia encephala TaxID=71784 RepID=A0A1Y2BB97_9TREE|nr:hypothetical protein BCR39DRAFT_557765 [Naematelia encephala]